MHGLSSSYVVVCNFTIVVFVANIVAVMYNLDVVIYIFFGQWMQLNHSVVYNLTIVGIQLNNTEYTT
jgi:hypothetical protein